MEPLCDCSALSNMVMRVGRPGYQREMQFIYTSSHGGREEYTEFTKLDTWAGWVTYAKIKISRTPPFSPNDPSMQVAHGGEGDGENDAWKEKPPLFKAASERIRKRQPLVGWYLSSLPGLHRTTMLLS